MKNNKGFVLSTYVYMLLVFFLLLLGTMLAVLNNTKLLSNKLKENASTSSGLTNNEFNMILLGDKEITILLDSEYIDPGYIAKTVSGADISGKVEVVGELDTSQIGEYILTYRIKHDGKTKELERKIHVKDNIAVNYINELYLTEKEKNGLIVDDTADQNIRYVGANPKNKVYFNCKDEYINENSIRIKYGDEDYDYKNKCEIWRIIGVFDTKSTESETETPMKRVKIVRDAFSIKMSWDSSVGGEKIENSVNYGEGINQWGESTYTDGTEYEGADLMRMLNGYYIGKSSTCTYCNGTNQGTCSNDCSSSITPLSNTSLNMVADVFWNIGAQNWVDAMPLETMYNGERGTQIGKICEPSSTYDGKSLCTDTVNRTTSWIGKIGLIYPSDYGFASTDKNCASDILGDNSTCENDNWLHPSEWYWTLSPHALTQRATVTWHVNPTSSAYYSGSYYAGDVRPSLYLLPNAKIAGGNGGDEPYKLKI